MRPKNRPILTTHVITIANLLERVTHNIVYNLDYYWGTQKTARNHSNLVGTVLNYPLILSDDR